MAITISELTFLDLEAPVLDATTPDATVWTDDAAGPVAFGATRGAWHWLRLAGVGSYRFPVEPDGLRVACGVVAGEGASRRTVIDSYYRTVVPLALQAYGLETLHGSAVALPGGVVALCADRETGKSTIAFALQRRGHGAVADDSVVLAVPDSGTRVTVHALPFALRLRHASAEHFGSPGRDSVRIGADDVVTSAGEASLAAVVMLARHDGPVTLTRLAPNEAFPLLLAQSHAFSMAREERKRAMMTRYMRLATLVACHRLAFPAGLEHLPTICAALESLGGDAS